MKWRRANGPPPAGSAIRMGGKRSCPASDRSEGGVPDSPAPEGIARPLLVFFLLGLLPLTLDVERPGLAPDVGLPLTLELLPLDLQFELDGELVILYLPLGGERQLPVLEFH